MSEKELTGGPSAAAEAPQAAPGKTPDILAAEIRTIKAQTGRMVLAASIEVGRRLTEAKAMLPHGSWGEYLKKEVDYSPSQAQNLMRVFREYGAEQQSLFGGEAKSQTFGHLTFSQALSLLVIPDEEERERFALENDVAHMSVRELEKALKERDEARKAAETAQAEASAAEDARAQMEADMTDMKQIHQAAQVDLAQAKEDLKAARAEARQIQEALDWKVADVKQKQDLIDRQAHKANQLQSALIQANAAAQEAREEQTRLARELEDLRSRPVDVAVEVDEKAVEAARKAAVAEMEKKLKKAKDAKEAAEGKRKAAEEALEATRKELAELKAKGPEVRELTQEEKDAMTAEAVERIKAESAERMQALEKQLSKADPDTTTLMVLFKGWQETYTKMWETLHRIDASDGDKGQKLRGGIRKALETALEQI